MEVQGHRTLEAVDGPAGLDMAVQHRPDLILMDVQLPGMDDYEVTRQLKARDDTKAIPIIAVTSFAMKGEEDRARQAGWRRLPEQAHRHPQAGEDGEEILERG